MPKDERAVETSSSPSSSSDGSSSIDRKSDDSDSGSSASESDEQLPSPPSNAKAITKHERKLLACDIMERKLLNSDKNAIDEHLGPAFKGCAPCLGWCGLCCCLGFLIPLAVILPINLALFDSGLSLWIIFAMFMTLGFCFCCISIKPTVGAALPPPLGPSPSPQAIPLLQKPQKPAKPVKHLAVILNPYGGGGIGTSVFDRANIIFKEKGVKAKVFKTERAGHGFHLARNLDLHKFDAVVAVGGDGSAHDVLNGLMSRDDALNSKGEIRCPAVFGILPGGTGNCICRGFDQGDFPTVESVANWICEGYVAHIDMSAVDVTACSHISNKPQKKRDAKTFRVFSIMMIATGIAADVSTFADNFRAFGALRYDIGAVWMLLASKFINSKITITCRDPESGAEQDALVWKAPSATFFANKGQFIGKGLHVTPDAQLDDGNVAVESLIPVGTRGSMLGAFLLLPEARHKNVKDLIFAQGTKVKFESSARTVLSIDGENYPLEGGFSVEVIPRCLPLLVPKDANKPWSKRAPLH